MPEKSITLHVFDGLIKVFGILFNSINNANKLPTRDHLTKMTTNNSRVLHCEQLKQ